MAGYFPRADSLARDWMITFVTKLVDEPSRYGLLPADAASIEEAVNLFAAAYSVCVDKDTRSSSNIITKDKMRAQAERLCRFWAQTIKRNAGVTDADKNGLGIHLDNTTPAPIVAPSSSPSLMIVGATPGAHTLRYHDSMAPTARKKPFGAESLYLFATVSDTVAADQNEARFIGRFKRNPMGIPFTRADDGKVATYFARWSGPRGDVGPWSLPVSMRIAA